MRLLCSLTWCALFAGLVFSPGLAAGSWFGPCGADADCDDGNPCTTDSCNTATGSCRNLANDPQCCQTDADCFDGDPCVVGWCDGTPPSSQCEYHSLYPGCCYAGHTEHCDPAHDPCFSGACTFDLYGDFGGCTLTPLCCSADMQCDDQNDATLDSCNTDVCQFESSGEWCDPGGFCPSGGMRVEQLPGFDLAHFLDCDACIARPLWQHCGIPTNCPGVGCCEVDADCRGTTPWSQNWCDTTTPCTVNDLGIPVGDTSGTCVEVGVDGCVEPRDCVLGAGEDPAEFCESYSDSIPVPICHSITDSFVSKSYFCDENGLCQELDSLCSADMDCELADECLVGRCSRFPLETVGKCVYLPKDWEFISAEQKTDIQLMCMDAHTCKRVTCGLDFKGGSAGDECPADFDPTVACTTFGPGYSHCVAQQLAGSALECCTNDFDCDDSNPTTADRCFDGKCSFPFKLPCTYDPAPGADNETECMVSNCVCMDAECSQLQCYGGCVMLMTCTDDGDTGEGDYCYPTVIADDGMACNAFFDECFSDGLCDAMGICEMPEPPGWSCMPDGNECTIENVCDPETGCQTINAQNGTPCVGENPCQEYECLDGLCAVAGSSLPDKIPCQPEESCQVHVCEQGQCTQKGLAAAGTPCRPQQEADPCRSHACDILGSCLPYVDAPDGTACEVPCGTGECSQGECTVTVPEPDWSDCPVQDVCKRAACLGGKCVTIPEIVADGTACPRADTCQQWTCQGGECRFDAAAQDGQLCSWDRSCYQWSCLDDRCVTIDEQSFGPQECSVIPPEESCVTWQCSDWVCLPDQVLCDDSDECTEDLCVAPGLLESCIFVDVSAACDDSNPCTQDSCDPVMGCQYSAVPGSCDDGSACTTGDYCDGGFCIPGTPTDCDDSDPCTVDTCNPSTGECEYSTEGTDGNPCDDGTVCTFDDECLAGVCTGTSLDCDDSNVCTDDSCDSETGCNYVPNESSCDAGNACYEDDYCSAGVCQPGTYIDCGETGNPCTTMECDPVVGCQGPLNLPVDVPCPGNSSPCTFHACDGNGLCELRGTAANGAPCKPEGGPVPCQAYECQAGQCHFVENASDVTSCAVECGTGECVAGACNVTVPNAPGTPCGGPPCQEFACNGSGECVDQSASLPDGSPCGSENPCEERECISGVCEAAQVKAESSECHWFGSCKAWECSPTGTCTVLGDPPPDPPALCGEGTECVDFSCTQGLCEQTATNCSDDGYSCTNAYCLADGVTCAHLPLGDSCDDFDICTDDVCDTGSPDKDPVTGCVNSWNTSPCDDGDACTESDTCSSGTCAGATVDCDDADPCTNDYCDVQTGCYYEYNTAPCEEGDLCSINDACDGAGNCIPGDDVECDDDDICTVDSCDSQTGQCVFDPVDCSAYESDENVCTVPICLASQGGCVELGALDCDDQNPCTEDSCDPVTGCSNSAAEGGCEDGDPCTVGDTCVAGQCTSGGGVLDCDDGNPCTVNECMATVGCQATPLAETTPCDDQDACTQADICITGICVGAAVDCDDADSCTVDLCVPASGCVPVESRPAPAEECDGLDNDCDGLVDEGVKNPCGGCSVLANPPGASCADGAGLYLCGGTDSTYCDDSPQFVGDDCGPTPVTDAVVHGRVLHAVTKQPIADVKIWAAQRSYFQCTGHVGAINATTATGEFHVPVVERGKHVFDFKMPGFITAQKEVNVTSRNGTAGIVYMLPVDSKSNPITGNNATEQTATSSNEYNEQPYIKVVIPQNTVIETLMGGEWVTVDEIDMRLTWYPNVESLPGPLPETSHFTYAINFQPEDTRFSNDLQVSFLNPAPKPGGGLHGGFAAGSQIPVGLWKPEVGEWQQLYNDDNGTEVPVLGTVSGDGVWIEFPMEHFSSIDCNLPVPPPPTNGGDGGDGDDNQDGKDDAGLFGDGDKDDVKDGDGGGDKDDGPKSPSDCPPAGDSGGSTINRQSGSLRVYSEVPGAVLLGKQRNLRFVYDSSTAVPKVFLSAWYDYSNFSPSPERMKFSWGFEGQQDEVYYQPGNGGTAYAAVLLDAANGVGEKLPTGLYPYFLDLSAQYWSPEYVFVNFFGLPPLPADPGAIVPPIVEKWVSLGLVGDASVVNLSAGPFGSGWSIAGHMELHEAPFSGSKMVVVSGSPIVIRQAHKIRHTAGIIQTQTAHSTGDGGDKLTAGLEYPRYAAQAPDGRVLTTEHHRIRAFDESGIMVTVAGCGELENCPPGVCRPDQGEDCTGKDAKDVYLDRVWDVEVAANGEIYFSSREQDAIFKIDNSGLIHEVVGRSPSCDTNDPALESACEPTGLALEETSDGPNVYYLSSIPSAHPFRRGVRRIRPDGVIEAITKVDGSFEFNGPEDLMLLAQGELLVSERPNHKVHHVSFVESQGQIDVNATQVTVFAGTGTPLGLGESIQEGVADQQPISYPTGLATGPDGDVYVAMKRGNGDDQIARIVPNGDDQGNWIIVHYAGGFTDTLQDGADPDDVQPGGLDGLAWIDDRLVFVSSGYNSIWSVESSESHPGDVFTYLRKSGPEWKLGQRGGMVHTFNANGRHLSTVDRWGRTTTYQYGEKGLSSITWYGGYRWVLDYGDDTQVDSVQLQRLDDPTWVDVGAPAGLSYENGNLITMTAPDASPMQYHYDGGLMTKRYASTVRSDTPDRAVEYTWKNAMVDTVIFHDEEESYNNREYIHSRERLLPESSEAAGDYDDPIPQPEDIGWDVTVDGEDRETHTRYDRSGRLLEAIRKNGSKVVYERDDNGRTTAIKLYDTPEAPEPLEESSYSYTEDGKLASATFGQSTWSYLYETKSLPPPNDKTEYTVWSGVISPEGERTILTYDDYGNRLEVAELVEWTEDQGIITPVKKYSYKNAYSDPAAGQLAQVCDADCMAKEGDLPAPGCDDAAFDDCRITLAYDDQENVVSISSEGSGLLSMGRTPDRGQVSSITMQVDVGDQGQLSDSTWSVVRDAWGSPVSVTNPGSGQWLIEHTNKLASSGCGACSGGPLVAKVQAPSGEFAQFAWSIAGRLVSVSRHAAGAAPEEYVAAVDISYDRSGYVLSSQLRDTQTLTSFTYDPGGTLEKVSQPVSGADQLEWLLDLSKRRTLDGLTTPDGADWQFTYNELRLPMSASENTSGRDTLFERDLLGRLTQRTLGEQPAAPSWAYEYDSVGRLDRIAGPSDVAPEDGTLIDRAPSGWVKGLVKDGAAALQIATDIYERFDSAARAIGGTYLYDVSYDVAGKPTSLTGSWTIGESTVELIDDYEYDASGRLSKVKADLNSDLAVELEVTYGYDSGHRLQSVSLQGGQSVNFYRDGGSRLKQVDFVASGQVRRRTVIGYSSSSWLGSLETGSPLGAEGLDNAEVLDLAYFYDFAGRIVRIEEGDGARVLGYDKGSRLQSSHDYDSWPGGAPGEQRLFTYDKLGQRQSTNFNGVAANYTWSEYGELQTVIAGGVTETFTFDDDGNLETVVDSAAGTELEFVYDSAGRVAEVSDGDTRQHYAYWPDERRARVETDDGDNGSIDDASLYFSDGLLTHVIDEATKELQRSYVFLPNGYTPVMMVTYVDNIVDKAYFYHNDHLSTPRAMTDESGAIVWQSKPAPFGELLATCDPDCAIEQPIRFPGQWDDAVSGVWYNWHRFYLPGYGMYARRDPIRRLDGGEYNYVGGNPLSAADPWGLAWVYIWDKDGPGGSKVGHAAISSEDRTEYLSYSPDWGPGDHQFKSWEEDIEHYKGHGPDQVFHIEGVSEASLKIFIKSYKDYNSKWMPGNNCVDSVLEALDYAGSSFLHEYFDKIHWGGISHPSDLVPKQAKINPLI